MENTKDTQSWLNKYNPTCISDIIGNKSKIDTLIKWIRDENKKNNSIIITGNHGIGKTNILKLILKKYNFNIKIIFPNDIKNYRNVDNLIENINVNNYISKILTTDKFINNAIIFDDIENITLVTEKKYILELYKKNNKNKNYIIVFISNNSHSKLLYELKRDLQEIIFNNPLHADLYNFIIRVYENENIKIVDKNSLNKIILFSQYDIRRLIIILQELTYHIKDNILSNETIDEYILLSNNKNIDIGLYESIKYIFNNYKDYITIYRLYQFEKVLLPLMVYENYINMIDTDINMKEKLKNINIILDSLSLGDNVETSIYTEQNWNYQIIHSFFSCIKPTFYINKNKDKIDMCNIKFTTDLNKTSLKNINKKNIANLIKIININNIEDILLLNNICVKLLNNKDIVKFNNIIQKYKNTMSIKDIDLFFKIDKTI